MSFQSFNLFLRFLLELVALVCIAMWLWLNYEGWGKYVLVFVIPVSLATIWGVFAVPNDPSRSGKTVVPTKGWIRLLLELAIFGIGFFALFDSGFQDLAYIFGSLVTLHYAASHKRIKWLLSQ